MSYSSKYEQFIDAYNDSDFDSAADSLFSELGDAVISQREDFVCLLNECGISADESDDDDVLIDKFVKNAADNKELRVGAALLTGIKNKRISYDGTDELNNDSVKAGYEVLNEHFSGLIPLIAGAAAKVGGKLLDNRKERKNAELAAKSAMQIAAQKRKQAAAANAAKLKETKMYVIGGVVAVSVIIVGLIVIATRK